MRWDPIDRRLFEPVKARGSAVANRFYSENIQVPNPNRLLLEKANLMAKKLKRLIEELEQRLTRIERTLASSRVADAGREPRAISETDKTAPVKSPVRKRSLSTEARERIAAAQRKRWALKRKATKKGTKKKAA
jgi:hypothetical protein